MAKTTVGLVTGREFLVDEAIEGVKAKIDDAGGRWVALTVDEGRVEVASSSVAYLIQHAEL